MERASSSERWREEEPSTSSRRHPDGEHPGQQGTPGEKDPFIRHKLHRLDTLAGLAIRYNVTVSDIKHANGLLTDTAMFARDVLLIPTSPLMLGADCATWAGMIVTHFGRITASDLRPSGAPYRHLSAASRSVQQLRGYYSTGPSAAVSPRASFAGEDEDRQHLLASRLGRRLGGGEVELMARSGTSAAERGSTHAEEKLRRRKAGELGEDAALAELPPGANQSRYGSGAPQPAAGGSQRLGGAASAIDFQRTANRLKEGLASHMKRATSQPALRNGAANGVPNPGGGRAGGDGLQPAAQPPPSGSNTSSGQRHKTCPKKD